MNNKWTYNLGNKEHWDSEEMFETREEAIKEGKLEAIKCDFVEYEVGMVEEFISFIDTEDAIEIINERAYNEVGECAESYLENLEKDELHELHEKINSMNESVVKMKSVGADVSSMKMFDFSTNSLVDASKYNLSF